MGRLFFLALVSVVLGLAVATAVPRAELSAAEAEAEPEFAFVELADEAAVDVADEAEEEAEAEAEAETEEEAEDEDQEEVEAEAEDEDESLETEAEEEEEAQEEEEGAEDEQAFVEMDEAFVPAHTVARDICPRMDQCPACPFPRKVLNSRACLAAADEYSRAYGDSDAVAAIANRDTVFNAFMAGVIFADSTTGTSYNQRIVNRRHHLKIMDAVRAGRNRRKGCPKLPDTMDCPCPQLLNVAHEKDTQHQALKRALTAGENERKFDWSLPDAVRQAFLDGVAHADRIRLVRFAGAGVPLSEGTAARKLERVRETQNALEDYIKTNPIY